MEKQHLKTLHNLPYGTDLTSKGAVEHCAAMTAPQPGVEQALVEMLTGWLRYADAHDTSLESSLENHSFSARCWATIGGRLRGLLESDIGRLNAPALDDVITHALEWELFHPDTGLACSQCPPSSPDDS